MSLRRAVRILKRVVFNLWRAVVFAGAYTIAFFLATMMWIVDKILGEEEDFNSK